MAKKSYSRKAEASVYPIKTGNVILPNDPVLIFNPKLNEITEHRLFIWVLRESRKRKKGALPKRRRISVFYYYEPLAPDFKEKYLMTRIKSVQFETVARYLVGGYKLIAEGITYNYRPEDIVPFYRVIGVV